MERHEHPAAHVLPSLDLLVAELQPGADGVRAWCRQQVEQVRGDVADPRHEDVGVGVVAEAALGRARVLLVVLVRAHHAVDLVAFPVGRVVGGRRPEPCDAEHQLRAVGFEEHRVLGGDDVLPDVVEDRGADVPLVVGQVDVPLPRHRVEVDLLGLLGAERSALPGEHEAGAPGGPGGGARLGQATVAVHEQTAGDTRQPVREERQDEQLVPEHVAAVGLAVDPSGGDAGVEIGGVGRTRLQDVADVDAQEMLGLVVAEHLHVARLPKPVPRLAVVREGGLERPRPGHRAVRPHERVARRGVARGEQRHRLLHGHRHPALEVEVQRLLDVVGGAEVGAWHLDRPAGGEDTGPGGDADGDLGLAGPGLERHHFRFRELRSDGVEVGSLEVAVAGHAVVGDAPVDRADDLGGPGPVERGEGPLEVGVVHRRHGGEPAADQFGLAPLAVAEAQVPGEHRGAEVEPVTVVEDLHVREAQDLRAADPEFQRQPVRQVDQVLVVDRDTAEQGGRAVVEAVDVGAGVMDVVGLLPLGRAAGGHVPVAGRGEGFAQALVPGIDAVVGEGEGGVGITGGVQGTGVRDGHTCDTTTPESSAGPVGGPVLGIVTPPRPAGYADGL